MLGPFGEQMRRELLSCNALFLALVGFSAPAGIQAAEETTGIKVTFEGNHVFTADQLLSEMLSCRKGGQRSSGKSNVTVALEDGLRCLRNFLMAEGYLTPWLYSRAFVHVDRQVNGPIRRL